MSLKPQTIMVIENNIAIKWEDQSESYLSNKELRDKCPCANCSGESDVFGNIYKGEVSPETSKNADLGAAPWVAWSFIITRSDE